MKTIFKKNQIIITALAIMIAVVGYLNFAKDKEAEGEKEKALATAGTANSENYDATDEFGDLSAEDLGEDNQFFYQVSDTGELILQENAAAANTENGNGAVEGTKPADAQELADAASGEETGEEQTTGGDSVPGEAVFTSVTIWNGYFSNAKLNREQMRARNKETLMEVVSDATVADELKQEAIDEIIAMTARAENENAAELLLEAKGYQDVVVSLSETEVDVVVNAASITEQQTAQIEDIVSRKTGISADGIVITTVVMEE